LGQPEVCLWYDQVHKARARTNGAIARFHLNRAIGQRFKCNATAMARARTPDWMDHILPFLC
jgi:hypothetical protein